MLHIEAYYFWPGYGTYRGKHNDAMFNERESDVIFLSNDIRVNTLCYI